MVSTVFAFSHANDREKNLSLATLIDSNIAVLRQAQTLITGLSDVDYCLVKESVASSSVGTHIRHIVEHYQSFTSGSLSGVVDYNRRPRQSRIELSREAALGSLERLIGELIELRSGGNSSKALQVLLQTTTDAQSEDSIGSTVGREMVFLHGHAIHHFAQLALQLRERGIALAPDFGVAPSTLEYQAEPQDSVMQVQGGRS